jgi:hypothetical protein
MSILKGLARVSAKPAGAASPDTATLSPVSESQKKIESSLDKQAFRL